MGDRSKAMASNTTRAAAEELVRVAPRLGRYLRRVIESETGSQSIIRHAVLKTLAQQAYGNAELAAMLSVSGPTMTGLIDQLVRGGLVRRDPHPGDRRAVRLTITDQGRSQLAATQEVLVDAVVEIMRDRDPAELTALITGLRALDAALAGNRSGRNVSEKQKRERAGSALDQ
jgi:DNA-binding MarR family transcriptional regulator